MAIINPAYVLDSEDHTAEEFRHMIRSVTRGAQGPIDANDLVVDEASTPDMSVDVAAGECLIVGTESVDQNTYLCHNPSSVNLAIAAADATNDRYDIVIAKVEDSAYSGATDAWSLAVVTGTPAATPADPALPDNHIPLARVEVAALAASIVDADITSLRVFASLQGQTGLYTAPDTPIPAVTSVLGSINGVTFNNPNRLVYVKAYMHGYVDHVANLSTRQSNAYTVRISIDGGSTWDTGEAIYVDINRTSMGAYRVAAQASHAIGPVTPTDDIVVQMLHDQSAGAAAGDTDSRSWSLMADWYPA